LPGSEATRFGAPVRPDRQAASELGSKCPAETAQGCFAPWCGTYSGRSIVWPSSWSYDRL